MIELDDALLGIEVKLDSGLSSDDNEEEVDFEYSRNQLVKYARMIKRIKDEKKKFRSFLIFIAPADKKNIYDSLVSGKKINSDHLNFFGFLSQFISFFDIIISVILIVFISMISHIGDSLFDLIILQIIFLVELMPESGYTEVRLNLR